MWKSFVLELHGEWDEFADEGTGVFSLIESSTRAVSRHKPTSRANWQPLPVHGRGISMFGEFL
jgi:hypothetical protein